MTDIPEPGQDGHIPVIPNPFDPIKPPYILPQRAGEPIKDEDGVYFRQVHRLDLSEGWCTAQQLMDFYGIPYNVLRDWALRGFVDPAVERGSQVHRFRVPDHLRCRRLASEWKRKHNVYKKPRITKAAREEFAELLERKKK